MPVCQLQLPNSSTEHTGARTVLIKLLNTTEDHRHGDMALHCTENEHPCVTRSGSTCVGTHTQSSRKEAGEAVELAPTDQSGKAVL